MGVSMCVESRDERIREALARISTPSRGPEHKKVKPKLKAAQCYSLRDANGKAQLQAASQDSDHDLWMSRLGIAGIGRVTNIPVQRQARHLESAIPTAQEMKEKIAQ